MSFELENEQNNMDAQPGTASDWLNVLDREILALKQERKAGRVDAAQGLTPLESELYEALLAVRNSPNGGSSQFLINGNVVDQMDAALAKARGEVQ